MIAEICFTNDWLERKRKELKGVDPSLLERALHAFALLGHLAESGLDFGRLGDIVAYVALRLNSRILSTA